MARATGFGSTELGDVAIHASAGENASAFTFDPAKSYRETRAAFEAELERRYVKWLLQRHDGNISGAARDAKMDRKHLSELAKKHGNPRATSDRKAGSEACGFERAQRARRRDVTKHPRCR